jgi:hypothetical protein
VYISLLVVTSVQCISDKGILKLNPAEAYSATLTGPFSLSYSVQSTLNIDVYFMTKQNFDKFIDNGNPLCALQVK